MINYNNISIAEAVQIQNELKQKITLEHLSSKINTIAGADISFNKFSSTVYAGIVTLSFPQLKILSYALVKAEVNFPYVPGFLAFREVPALLKAWNLLSEKPDVLIVDGHGIAHRRRMGIAAHFGALTNQCTMGCAKKILFGKYNEPGLNKFDYSPIYDKQEIIGWVYRSKNNVKPIFISPGNKMNIQDSLTIISQCLGKYRIPEPTRVAHEKVNLFRTGILEEGYYNNQD